MEESREPWQSRVDCVRSEIELHHIRPWLQLHKRH